jgi:hypothetical protein
MKYVFPLLLCVGVLLQTGRAAAGDTNICAKVSCGNHGNCIVKTDGNPVCACHEGYSPDSSTGLSCLPVSSSNAANAATAAAKPKQKQIPPPPPGQQCSVDEHCKHYTVCYEGMCISKNKKAQYVGWSKMTSEQRAKKANNLIISGAVLVGVGGALTIVGCINFFIGALDEKDSLFTTGLVLAPIGMVTVVIGASILSLGTKIKNYPARNETLGFRIPTKTREIILAPTIAVGDNTGLFGLSARF